MLKVRTVPASRLEVELQGTGQGQVDFTTSGAEGSRLAQGQLVEGRTCYECRTNGGEVRFEFVAGKDGGTVAYLVRSRGGIAIVVEPGR